MNIKNVMVVGAGQMGSGIAQVFAESGFYVNLYDLNEDVALQGKQVIKKFLTRSVSRNQISEEDKEETLKRITLSTSLEDAFRSDLCIEAVVEKMNVKKEVFTQLDSIAPEHALFASNTSSLSITEMAAVTKRPEQFIGMHFMNPVPVMELVEIVWAAQTAEETFQTTKTVAKSLNKTPIEVTDFPGFATNRILMPMINEAIFAVYEGVASVEDVDTVMKLGMNHPMGPLTLADFIGLDTCLYIMEVLYDGFSDSKYRPCPLLRKYVQAGWLGKKTKKGFYTYD